jgi:hypothetical protein
MRGSMSTTNWKHVLGILIHGANLVRTILPFFSPYNHPTIDLAENGSLYKIASGNHFDDS